MANDVTPKSRVTMTRPRGAVGRSSIDIQRVAEAIAGPGIDTRLWVKAGTVGVRNADGDFVVDDPEAVYADTLGTVVDVRIEPDDVIVTARWNGVGCGRFGRILFPIRPGDEVVVAVPDGDWNSGSIAILAVQSNATAEIADDWNNDRVLLDLNVPLEVRAPAIDMRSPNFRLNNRQVAFSQEGI